MDNQAKATIDENYSISSSGVVFSRSNWRGYGLREIKPIFDNHGYLRVRMTVNGKRKAFMVHRLVAKYFLPERPSPLHEIRHLNGVRTDNRAENLLWGTRKENAFDRKLHGNEKCKENGRKSVNKMLKTRRQNYGY